MMSRASATAPAQSEAHHGSAPSVSTSEKPASLPPTCTVTQLVAASSAPSWLRTTSLTQAPLHATKVSVAPIRAASIGAYACGDRLQAPLLESYWRVPTPEAYESPIATYSPGPAEAGCWTRNAPTPITTGAATATASQRREICGIGNLLDSCGQTYSRPSSLPCSRLRGNTFRLPYMPCLTSADTWMSSTAALGGAIRSVSCPADLAGWARGGWDVRRRQRIACPARLLKRHVSGSAKLSQI